MKKLLLTLTTALTLSTVSLSSAQTLNLTSTFNSGAASIGAAYEVPVDRNANLEFGVGATTAGVYDVYAGVNAKLNRNFYVPVRVGAAVGSSPTVGYASLGLGAQSKVSNGLAVFGELNSRMYFNNSYQVGFPQARFGVKLDLK